MFLIKSSREIDAFLSPYRMAKDAIRDAIKTSLSHEKNLGDNVISTELTYKTQKELWLTLFRQFDEIVITDNL